MRARIGILIVLTVAALAVFEATSPAEKRLLFPAPASMTNSLRRSWISPG